MTSGRRVFTDSGMAPPLRVGSCCWTPSRIVVMIVPVPGPGLVTRRPGGLGPEASARKRPSRLASEKVVRGSATDSAGSAVDGHVRPPRRRARSYRRSRWRLTRSLRSHESESGSQPGSKFQVNLNRLRSRTPPGSGRAESTVTVVRVCPAVTVTAGPGGRRTV